MVDSTKDLRALARRLAEYSKRPGVSDEMSKDLGASVDIVWEYMVLIEPEEKSNIEQHRLASG
jgi:hypothetical protein